MLGERVVAGFPAVQALFTQETLYIVGAVGARIIPETGFGKLSQCQQIIKTQEQIFGDAYTGRCDLFMRPVESLGSSAPAGGRTTLLCCLFESR